MKIGNRTLIFPHIILVTAGRLLAAACIYAAYLLGDAFVSIVFKEASSSVSDVIMAYFAVIAYFILLLFFFYNFWQNIFGGLVVTDTYVKWHGLFMIPRKLKFSDIKCMEIRTMGKENAVKYDVYNTGFRYLLISTDALPQKKLNKIRTERNLIKFQVTPKICGQLYECMPTKYRWMFAGSAHRKPPNRVKQKK